MNAKLLKYQLFERKNKLVIVVASGQSGLGKSELAFELIKGVKAQ